MLSRFLSSLAATLTVVLLTPSVAWATEVPDEPALRFAGGGWGHGVGMSQHGALGRALDGHSYADILAFYYDGSTLVGADTLGLSVDLDDVDVHLTTQSTVTLTPVGGEVGLELPDVGEFSRTDRSVTVTFDGAVWHAVIPHEDPAGEPTTHDLHHYTITPIKNMGITSYLN